MVDPTQPDVTSATEAVPVPSRGSTFKALAAMALGLVLIFWSSDTFLDFASTLHSNTPLLHSLDVGVHDWSIAHRTPSATLFFLIVTTLGGPAVLSVIALILTVILWRRKHKAAGIFLTTTVALGYALDFYLKHHYSRARPDLTSAVRGAHGFSFPSGHAMGSACFLGAVAYLVLRSKTSTLRKVLTVVFSALLLIAVCWSRVYLGVHWPTDVIAGAGLGLTWLIAMIIAQESLSLVRRRRKQSN